jgi:lysophospholipase L1-like esterase
MADAKGAMLPGLSSDGVHPTAKGYEVMAPLAEHAIAQALAH